MNTMSAMLPGGLQTAIESVVNARLEGVHVALPGRVESYSAKTRKAKVTPCIQKVYLGGKVASMPALVEVPVVWPFGGGGGIAFPLQKNDGVLLLFAERNIENFLAAGSVREVRPRDARKHALSDAIAVPGLYPFKSSSPFPDDAAVMTWGGGTVKLQKGGKVAIGNSRAELLDILSEAINLLATAVCAAPGQPLSVAPQAAALKVKLDTMLKGSL